LELKALLRRRRRLCFLLVAFVVGVLLVREINSYLGRNFPSYDSPPEYTSQSVWDTLKEDNETSQGLHTNAIPFLIEHLRYKPSDESPVDWALA
jgi:hypothetical protein